MQPVFLVDLLDLTARALDVEGAERAGRLDAQHHVLGHGEHGHEHEVLVDHTDPCRDPIAGTVKDHRLAVDQDLALVGRIEPREHVHHGGFTGAIFAKQPQHLARANMQVHLVVGHDRPETLGYPAQFDVHRHPTLMCSEL